MSKVKVDKNKCIGCGACESLCPDCFELIDGVSNVKNDGKNCGDCAKEAADMCPVGAITVEDED